MEALLIAVILIGLYGIGVVFVRRNRREVQTCTRHAPLISNEAPPTKNTRHGEPLTCPDYEFESAVHAAHEHGITDEPTPTD